ncbi:DUF1127 domain-containing protein [Sedimentitalea nanhaiensis]|uniref:Uncharacterized conserved protein YjiS, DUF1127 family n=1 Tax=Sedimentitalea nanhaiensis TaxID=999627 RepID=A0A1I6Y7L4_9RHOB|nr:DUF1127 domain-containing protein [Sedimentitalea nanhaiensis]SFT46440.1 Uncharacterized conserved protein YjiS, DUF1127 family [Sedimentitalea nanhaiensis]
MTALNAARAAPHCTPSLGRRLVRALGLWRQRRALRRLDAKSLCDIGITRAQAEAEARRPLWDAPANWRI